MALTLVVLVYIALAALAKLLCFIVDRRVSKYLDSPLRTVLKLGIWGWAILWPTVTFFPIFIQLLGGL